MSAADRTARLVTRWARLYTRGLPSPVAQRRITELQSDLHEHIAEERRQGRGELRIAAHVGSRMLRGVPADASWRSGQGLAASVQATPEARVRTSRAVYRRGLAAAIAGMLFMVWLLGAVGIVGAEGDGPDRMYLGVLAGGVVGAAIARFRAAGMSVVLGLMASAMAVVAVVAIATDQVPAYNSPFELIGLNAMFAVVFAGASWLFRRAALHRAGTAG